MTDDSGCRIRLAPSNAALLLSLPSRDGKRPLELTISADERGMAFLLSALRRVASSWGEPRPDAIPLGARQANYILAEWERVCKHDVPLTSRCFACEEAKAGRESAGKVRAEPAKRQPAAPRVFNSRGAIVRKTIRSLADIGL